MPDQIPFVQVGELHGYPLYMEQADYKKHKKEVCAGKVRAFYPQNL